ncbi:Pre-rRNA-processing protein TSR1 [Thelohanellus kitauei]|uniref:Pre-rRNA-processing protein TSR1 homolog n=1 Tax=Thelohanellus kitauei TaxID=669202 RepID=A0A0C2INW8_THEKT|nr:Pre-rRNA-processing protein TSR1 [Thelohanellus kitauei]
MSDSEVNDADESEGFDCSDSEESECEKYDTSNYFTSLQECLFYGQLCDNPNHRKIIQLQNYKAAFNRAIEYKEDDAVEAGQYVKIFIQNIPEFIYEYFWKFVGRLILYRLHPFEDQLSVVHYLIHKKDYTPDIFSNVIECVSGEAQVVVSLVGYLTFPNAEVTLFSQSSDGELTYIGGGHVLPISKRLLVNELVLTGSIRRAFKKTTIVKGIFHSREEASRFKEIEIFTENGGKGHMIKPIGTHGTIKCHFTLTTNKSQTVYGKLYKPQPLICDIETKVYLPSQHLL